MTLLSLLISITCWIKNISMFKTYYSVNFSGPATVITTPLHCNRHYYFFPVLGFPDSSVGKESTCQCRRHKRCMLDPWVGKISWRRAWQPTPVFLLGKSHGQRSLMVYSLWITKSQTRLKWFSMHAMFQQRYLMVWHKTLFRIWINRLITEVV